MERCRALGLKLTHQRLAIYKALATDCSHPSAEDIHRGLQHDLPTLSLDTVYRTLLFLERHGLIRRLEVLDDRARFDANLSDHHHLVCIRCRRAVDISWPAIEGLDMPDAAADWGQIQSRHMELRGVCAGCLTAE
jgi:Fur family peroxide stress response transcriptional regulator